MRCPPMASCASISTTKRSDASGLSVSPHARAGGTPRLESTTRAGRLTDVDLEATFNEVDVQLSRAGSG